jgi:hypothetical protein
VPPHTHSRTLARSLGHGVINKFLTGRSTIHASHFRRIAKELRAPLEAVLVTDDWYDEEGCWKLRSILDPDDDRKSMDNYTGICGRARQHWAVHRGLSSYLMHPDHFLVG